jgi:hypothetical protein
MSMAKLALADMNTVITNTNMNTTSIITTMSMAKLALADMNTVITNTNMNITSITTIMNMARLAPADMNTVTNIITMITLLRLSQHPKLRVSSM